MRPPLNAGENVVTAVDAGTNSLGFNEAPAERGGERLRPEPFACRRALLQ